MENRAVYFRTENCSVCEVLRPKLMKLFEEKYPGKLTHVANVLQGEQRAGRPIHSSSPLFGRSEPSAGLPIHAQDKDFDTN